MHSSVLRGKDFTLSVNGEPQPHADFFHGFTATRRLGLVTLGGVEGVGAVNLVMAYMTAFYDTYRATAGLFYANADYYTFQNAETLASYTWLDIWPEHKDVPVPDDARVRLNALNDRAINILLVPDMIHPDPGYGISQLESAQRNIDTCYAYAFDGQVESADLTIECQKEPLSTWIQTIFDTPTLSENKAIQQKKAQWNAQYQHQPTIKQSFRRITLADALLRL